jgi:hypothetical protein
VLVDEAAELLGFLVFITRERKGWKWSVPGIMCLGLTAQLPEAKCAAIEAVLRWLGPPKNYAACQRLAKIVGYDFV